MAISTYAELKTAIADFLNRDDLSDTVLDQFIGLAESRIQRDLRHRNQEKRATAPLNERYEILPPDFLFMRRLTLNDGSQVQPISSAEMADRRFKGDDIAGKPRFYYMTANELEFYPTPDETYTMTMLYYAKLDSLSDDNTATWLLVQHPDVYLYASLIDAAAYLFDEQKITLWTQMYKQAITELNIESKRSQFSGGALVMRNR